MARHSVTTPRLTGRDFRRLMLINGFGGAGLGLAFVAGVLLLDLARIRTLLVASGDWLVPLGLLAAGSVITFASVAMGGAIMLLARREASRAPPSLGPPIPVHVTAPQRRKSVQPDN